MYLLSVVLYLQYKMFLLNSAGIAQFALTNQVFTIQNVSIKFLKYFQQTFYCFYLQYKMFLLNTANGRDV